ncbi:MAG TPA: GAF domain-containing protein [Actinophytocola sp.]
MHLAPQPPPTSSRLPARHAKLSPRRMLAGALTGLVVLSLLTLGMTALRGLLNLPSQTLLYLLAVVVVALIGGLVPALAAAVAAAVLLDHYFIPPLGDFAVAEPTNVVALAAFLLVAGAASWVVGLAARRRAAEALAAASAESREEIRRLAKEQAALRRVATLVARGVPPAEVFAAVAHEVGSVLGADATPVARLEPDGATTVVAVGGDPPEELSVGSRWKPEPPLAVAEVLRTGRPARSDDYSQASGASGDAIRRMGARSGVAAPIIVEGRLWGTIVIVGRRLFPADAEQRMAGFTELVATAIANADSRAQLEESRDELGRLAQEQAALRRVATLVARGVPPAEVFPAVAQEVRHILGADASLIVRADPDGEVTVLARVGENQEELPIGSRWKPEPPLAVAEVLRTGRPARCDDYSQASGPFVDATVRLMGIRSSVAVPITVEGRLWGTVVAGVTHGYFPADAEPRMAAFTELVGTAIANADSRAQLTASRARIVAVTDQARRRIERDLHDGTQQRLVALSLTLGVAKSTVPVELPELRTQLGEIAGELTATIDELRELARGIHPASLSEGGLGAALRILARRAAIPVKLDIRTETRLADPIEVAAYYVVSEALTNTTKHGRASSVRVSLDQHDGLLQLSIRDDGVGGADPARGTGLTGLRDRVQALGGSIEVDSPAGEGTGILVELPLRPG